MARAYVFPGQGSQAVAMGKSLYDSFATAREVFAEVDDALDQHLTRLIFDGPEAELTATENAQPALMAVSLAVWRVLARDGGLTMAGTAVGAAGHSLGEYSALAAAGSLDLGDTARLLRTRGRAMQQAVPKGKGGMAALIGADRAQAEDVAAQAARAADADEGGGCLCRVANDNAPGQVVISGDKAAIDQVVANARRFGLKRAVPLNVSAPFHSPLMLPASEAMQAALADVAIAEPAVPIYSNVTAAPTRAPEEIRANLVSQVTDVVRWRESVEAMAADGVDELVELGSGTVLAGMARRIDRNLAARSVGTPADVEAYLRDAG